MHMVCACVYTDVTFLWGRDDPHLGHFQPGSEMLNNSDIVKHSSDLQCYNLSFFLLFIVFLFAAWELLELHGVY